MAYFRVYPYCKLAHVVAMGQQCVSSASLALSLVRIVVVKESMAILRLLRDGNELARKRLGKAPTVLLSLHVGAQHDA